MKKVFTYIGKFLAVVSVCTVIGSIAVGVYKLQTNVSDLVVTQKAETVAIDTLSNLFKRHTVKQEGVNGEVTKQLKSLNSTVSIIKSQTGKHILETTEDKEDIIEWFNAFEKKNGFEIVQQ